MTPDTLHIALLTDCFSTLSGGAERQIFELANRLNKNTFRVTVASLESDGPCPKDLQTRLQCPYKAFAVKRIYGISGIIQGIRFLRFLKKENINVLVTYHFSSDIWGAFWAKIGGIKTIISNRRDMGFWRSSKHIKAYTTINRWLKKIIVVSEAVKKAIIQEEHIHPDKIHVLHNGIDTSVNTNHARIEEIKKRYNIQPQDFIIAHVANLKPVKGHSFLLEALSQIIPVHPQVKLFLFGEDTLNGSLQQSAKQLNIAQHVLFIGKEANIREILPMAHICVLPSLSEGMSNAILEYMSAGKATVATNVGGNPELIRDGIDGLIVPPKDVLQLKNAILKLITDETLRNTMGASARQKIIENFAMDTMIHNYENFFKSLKYPKKKILHLISTSGFFGAEQVLLQLARRQNCNGTESIVGALKDPRLPQNELIKRARQKGLPTWELPTNGKFDLQTIGRLRKFIKEEDISLLHTHNYKSDLLGAAAAKSTRRKIIATVHGFTQNTRAVKLYENIDRWILNNLMDHVITVNRPLAQIFSQSKQTVIPNGIAMPQATNKREETRAHLSISPTTCLLGTVGRFSIEKNQQLLLQAFNALSKRFNHIQLLLIGDGPQRNTLTQFIEKEQLTKKVILTGIVEDPTAYYQAMDIFILSSDTEGLPMTLLEAMSHGIAPIASAVGGIPDIIKDNDTGMLFTKGTLSQLIDKCQILIQDETLRKRIGANAKELIKEKYSDEQTFHAYKNVYEKVLKTS